MKFSAHAKYLREALQDAQSVLSTGGESQLAFTGVRIAVTKSGVYATGTDGTVVVTRIVHGTTSETPGKVVLETRQLAAYLAALPGEVSVTVELQGPELSVRVNGAQPYKFRVLEVTYPLPLPTEYTSTGAGITTLANAFQSVKHAATRDGLGVQLTVRDGELTLDATDTFRLARATIAAPGIADMSVNLQRGVIERIAKVLPETLHYDARLGNVIAQGASGSVSAQVLATEFPAVAGVLDQLRPLTISVPTSVLRSALSRLVAISSIDAGVDVTVDGESLTLEINDPDGNSGTEVLHLDDPCTEPLKLRLQATYLADAVIATDTGAMTVICASSSTAPLLIRTSSKDRAGSVVAIIQPQRPLN
jgi:DNA polymerase III subunit beta